MQLATYFNRFDPAQVKQITMEAMTINLSNINFPSGSSVNLNSLYGAIIGAIIVSYAKTRFTAIMPEAWLFALGGLFVLVTLLLPKGIAGLIPSIKQKFAKPTSASQANS